MNILIIVGLIYFLFYIYTILFGVKIPLQNVNFFSGGLGQGKTLLATIRAIKLYKSKLFNYYIDRYVFLSKKAVRPRIYATYPILLKDYKISNLFRKKKNKKSKVYCNVLLKEHLTGKIRLPEKVIVVMDEASVYFPSENKKADKEIIWNFKFFRHFTDGHLFLTDQSISEISKSVRNRVNKVYILSNFNKHFLTLFRSFGMSVHKMEYSEDIVNFNNINDLTEFRLLSFFGKKRYESRYMKKSYEPKVDEEIRSKFLSSYIFKDSFDKAKDEYLKKIKKLGE